MILPATGMQTIFRNIGEFLSSARPRWPFILVAIACWYYVTSATTLPLADFVWFEEIPPLAIIQLPKAVIKSVVHDFLMAEVQRLGLSHGSFSPDYGMTHGWAMAIMLTVPALLLMTVLLLAPRVPHRRILIGILLSAAAFDAAVTWWFDSTFSFKLFNGSFF